MAGLSYGGIYMKAKIKTWALAALLLLLLAGCSQQDKYAGSINSDKYHKPSCEWAEKIKTENERWFSTEKEAQQAGYKPCKVCRP